ncbi:hypothetical protein [Staphylococcus gallinarum]|uniref:hypothetical protein n=1 Tax=Staphylococcus gallinarum TaxID=1293 RepID=UPI0030BC3B55
MKIKTKKQLNLPQLIEWGFDNPELAKGRAYRIDDENARLAPYVSFPADGMGVRVPCTITYDNTFTVEVEEEITEDTVLPTLIERRDYGNELAYSRYEYVRIKDIKGRSSTVFYIENDDRELVLIWRDGKLVE